MTLNLVSTTDSKEAIQAALGGKVELPKPAEASAPAEPEPEQNESVESDPAEGEEEEATESANPEAAKPGEGQDPNAPPRKKGGFQRRIDKLNARVADKERELEYWKQQAYQGKSAAEPEVEEPGPAPVAAEGKPNPDKFESHQEYLEALTDWKTEQKLQERDQKAAQARLQVDEDTKLKAYRDREVAFKEKTADFDEVIGEVGDVPLSPALHALLLDSDNSPDLVYALAKDPAEFKRINGMSPLALAREVGKLEARMSKPSEPQTKKTTQAPKPPTPVGSKGGTVQKNPEDMSYTEFKQWRESQNRR